MKYLKRGVILKYLYDQLTGNFMGFLVGLSATTLVSQFFETRSLRNLWGLTSKKTIVDKETFSNLEWLLSIIAGFVVFEIVTKVIKDKIDGYSPKFKIRVYRWAISKALPDELRSLKAFLMNKRVALLASTHAAIKHTFAKYSKR